MQNVSFLLEEDYSLKGHLIEIGCYMFICILFIFKTCFKGEKHNNI